jgi:subtilisin-like proprotein convertase family protein
MYKLAKRVHHWCIRCAPLVHHLRRQRRTCGGSGLVLGRFGGGRRRNFGFFSGLCLGRRRPGRDDCAGHVVLGFPAVLLLAGDHKDLLPGAGLPVLGDIRGGDVTLAVGRRTRQAQVADPPLLHPASAARRLAKDHDVFHRRTHCQPQPQVAGFVIVNGQVGHRVRAKNYGRRRFGGRVLTNQAQNWNKVSWNATNAAPTNGCSVEVYVRASDERSGLGGEVFVPATNGVSFPSIRGRFIEVRLGMVRDEPAKEPLLYDLTLYGLSSGFIGDDYIWGGQATEGEDAVFWIDLVGADPISYQWFRQYAWETNFTEVPGATNLDFTITNVSPWVGSYVDANGVVHFTEVACLVTNGTGESYWLGPAYLDVVAPTDYIPAIGHATNSGPATRYPITNHVFGLPTNFNSVSVSVTLLDLTHSRSADISMLLVSPLGKQIMLMSDVGGNNGVSGASILFQHSSPEPVQTDAIPPGVTSTYGPSNYGQVSQMPRDGTDPPPLHTGNYSIDLDTASHDDPNGDWKLYIYDRYNNANGHLSGSWQLNCYFR